MGPPVFWFRRHMRAMKRLGDILSAGHTDEIMLLTMPEPGKEGPAHPTGFADISRALELGLVAEWAYPPEAGKKGPLEQYLDGLRGVFKDKVTLNLWSGFLVDRYANLLPRTRSVAAQHEPRRSRSWAVVIVVIFVGGLVAAPVGILTWQIPYYHGISFEFADIQTYVGITFESDGPFSAGNPFWVYALGIQAFRLPWNVTSATVTIDGPNASFEHYLITVGPMSGRLCAWNQTCTPRYGMLSANVGASAGELLFFDPGNARIVVDLNLTHEGGWYFSTTNSFRNNTFYYPDYTIPLGPTDLVFQLLTLKLVAISIFAGGMLTGYFPTVRALEKYVRRISR